MSGVTDGTGRSREHSLSPVQIAALVFFTIFFLIPLSYILAGASVDEALRLTADSRVQRIALNTFLQALLSAIPSVLIAAPVAYFLAKFEFKGSSLLRGLILVPFFTPAFAYSDALFIMFGPNGVINKLLMDLFGFTTPPISILYSMQAVVLAHIFYYTPLAIFILEAGFESIDQDIIDAASVCGASNLKIIRRLILHQLAPMLSAAFALILVFSFLTFSTPLLVGGNFTTLELEIYFYWSRLGGWNRARSLSILQLMLNALFILVVFWARDRVFHAETVGRAGGLRRERFLFTRLSPSSLILFTSVVSILFFEVLPIYLIFASSFSSNLSYLMPQNPTLSSFEKLFRYDFGGGIGFSSSAGLTLAIAIVVSIFSLLASLITAYSIVHSKAVTRTIMGTFTSAPLATSATSLALGIFAAFGVGMMALYGRWEIIAIGHIIYIYPLTTRMLEAALIKVDPDLVDASLTLGASRVYTLLRVELPQIRSTLIGVVLIAFSSSASEFTYSYVFSTPGLQTMPVLVAKLLDSPLPPLELASAATTIIMAIILATAVGANLVTKRVGVTI